MGAVLAALSLFVQQYAIAVTVTAKQDGEWNCGTTWDTGQPPGPGDDVVIPAERSVVHSTPATPMVRVVDAFGRLLVREAALRCSGNFNVRPGGFGTLENGRLIVEVEDDRVFVGGGTPGTKFRDDTGVWVEGTLETRGDHVTPYCELRLATAWNDGPNGRYKPYECQVAETAFAVSGNAVDAAGLVTEFRTVTMPVGWRVGDQCSTASPEGSVVDCEIVSIEPMAESLDGSDQGIGAVVKVTGDLAGKVNALRSTRDRLGRQEMPRLYNLSRRCGIQGGTGHHKSHLLVMGMGTAILHDTELVDMGAEDKLGRYGLHFHHAMLASTVEGCTLRASDRESPINRGVAIHNSMRHVVRDVTIRDAKGRAFFMEMPTGKEIDCQLIGCTTLRVSGDAKGLETVTNPEGATYNASAHFWVRPGNIVQDCLAVGGTAVGFVVMPGIYKGDWTLGATDKPCRAWGVGRYGFQTGAPKITLAGPIATHCDVSGYGSTEKYGLSDLDVLVQDPGFLLNGHRLKPGAPFLTATDDAYIAAVYLNQSPRIRFQRGTFAGKKGFHTHYTTQVLFVDPDFTVDTGWTPTYYESDAVVQGGKFRFKHIDWPYPRSKSVHGRVRLIGTELNGTIVDKAFTAGFVQVDAGLEKLGTLPGPNVDPTRSGTVEVPIAQDVAGYYELPSTVATARWRQWGSPKVTWTPVAYRAPASFSTVAPWNGFGTGVYPGRYAIEGFDKYGKLVGEYDVTVEAGKVSKPTAVAQ